MGFAEGIGIFGKKKIPHIWVRGVKELGGFFWRIFEKRQRLRGWEFKLVGASRQRLPTPLNFLVTGTAYRWIEGGTPKPDAFGPLGALNVTVNLPPGYNAPN